MNIGMLWYDPDKKIEISEKINKAIEYYQNKYDRTPNTCFVHPSMIKEKALITSKIEMRISRSIMPNHFWLGTEVKS